MFDAITAGPAPLTGDAGQSGVVWPAALTGALLLHLAGFGAVVWLAVPRPPERVAEPMAIEISLEPFAAEAPQADMPEPPAESAPEPEQSAEDAPEPVPAEPEPPQAEAAVPESPPEPPPPMRQATPAPSPPRPRPRERRAAPGPGPTGAAASAAPTAPTAPAAPAGPPVVTAARFRRAPTPPAYPMVARERGITGVAIIRALVGLDGETKELRLHRSAGNAMLDEAAMAAVRRWSFEPSTRDGQRIEAWVEVPIRFELR